jgi:HSP20 family molecular chaperone IbpA
MSKDKRSFFERLTGTVKLKEEDRDQKYNQNKKDHRIDHAPLGDSISSISKMLDEEAELTVDMYQSGDMITIKTMVAGVHPEDLDVNITRDSVTIRGKRESERTITDDDYITRELYWGAFARTVELPEEIDVDGAEATSKHGLLILKLPKLDKKRQSKIKIRTI